MAKKHKCKDNDHLAKVAAEYDFFDWKSVWDANGSLNRANPNILFKGQRFLVASPDVVTIPEKTKKSESCAVDKVHVFQVPSYKLLLRLRILKGDFKPIADNSEYELKILGSSGAVAEWPDPDKKPAIKNGLLEVEIPVDAQKGILTVRLKAADTDKKDGAKKDDTVRGDVPVTWNLEIGALNPIMEKAPNTGCAWGVQQRLNNLAFDSGKVDGVVGPITKAATTEFQRTFKLKEDGAAGQKETQPRLQKVHDTSQAVEVPK